MSKEYPCIHYGDGGVCYKYTEGRVISYCVQGPCKDAMQSNADRIRSITDEELANTLRQLVRSRRRQQCDCPPGYHYSTMQCFDEYAEEACLDCWGHWLKEEHTANETDHH